MTGRSMPAALVQRGAALGNSLNSSAFEKHLKDEAADKSKRDARMKELGRSPSLASKPSVPPAKHSAHGVEPRSSVAGPAVKSSTPSGMIKSSGMGSRTQSSREPAGAAGFARRQSGCDTATRFLKGGRRAGVQEPDHREARGLRKDSRIGKLLKEFGGKDDWVSVTLLKHQLATILQAHVRGWQARKKWYANPEQAVNTLHKKMQDEAAEAERRAKLRRQLEIRSLTQKQKKVASNTINKMFGSKVVGSMHMKAAGSLQEAVSCRLGSKLRSNGWARLQKNADIAVQEITESARQMELAVEQGRDPSLSGLIGSDSDSEFSDLEMEDITAVKLRARTPPWQAQEESQRLGLYHKLHRNPAQSSLEMRWDLEACVDRLDACKQRRLERHPSAAQQEEEAQAFDPETQPLPPDMIANLLYPKYRERMIRLGLAAADDFPPAADVEESEEQPVQQQLDIQHSLAQPPTPTSPIKAL